MAMKIIDFETIRNLSISPADCVKWVETALRMKYDSCLPHKISMTIEPDVFFNTMPSYLPSCGRFGRPSSFHSLLLKYYIHSKVIQSIL